MSLSQAYIIFINSLTALLLLAIVIYIRKAYNILASGAPQITAPARVSTGRDIIKVRMTRPDVAVKLPAWKNVGYTVVKSHYEDGMLTLTMAKELNGDSFRHIG